MFATSDSLCLYVVCAMGRKLLLQPNSSRHEAMKSDIHLVVLRYVTHK